MSESIVWGCDVSKDWIDVCAIGMDGNPGSATRIANDSASIGMWLERLPAGCAIGMEATGRMHEFLAQSSAAAGHQVYVINPRWIARYRGAVGLRGKTDASDAQLIARYVAREGRTLHGYRIPSDAQQRLRDCLLRRDELAKLRAATKQSLGARAAGVLVAFDALMKSLEAEIRQLVRQRPAWQEQLTGMRRTPGIGLLVGAHLLSALDRIAFRTVDAFVAYTGLDPRPNDSGHRTGRRRLTHHGDSVLRKVLFMGAMAAIKRPEWRALYEHYRSKGLSTTQVFVILARKLARIAYAIYKGGQPYDPALVHVPGMT